MAQERSFFGRAFASRAAVVAAYAATVAIWGTTWLGIKFSLHGLPPVTGSGIRFIVAGAVLYALAAIFRGPVPRERPPLHLVIVLAVTMFGVNYALTYLAETHLASGLVAVLFGTMPFFIFAFAHYMTGERATRNTIAGALLALGGVAVISLVGSVRGDLFYVAAAIVAAASSGFANVYLKRYAQIEPLAALPPSMLVAGVGLTLYGVVFERIDVHAALATPSVVALLYLALCGSALAFYLNHWLLQRIDAGTMGLSALMIPVIAVIVGAVAGGEALGPREFLGAALVVGGVWLSLAKASPKRAAHPENAAVVAIEAESPALVLS